jgi:outer membrane protein, adhesin transport system
MINTQYITKSLLFLIGCWVASLVHAETLRESMVYTIHTNPDILITASAKLAAEQALRQQKAGYYPTLDATGAYGRERSRNSTTESIQGDKPLILTRTEAKLTAIENIFEGYRTVNEVGRGTAAVNSRAYLVQSTSLSTALKVVEVYLNVLRRQETVALATDNLKTHQHTYEMIKKRSESGLTRKADLVQAQGRLALAKATLITETGELENAQSNYLQTVGKLPTDLVLPTFDNRYLPANQIHAVNIALASNPAIKAANQDILATQYQHLASRSTNYPRFNIELSSSRNNNLDGVQNVNNDDLALITTSYNLYNGGADQARQRESAILVQSARETRDQVQRILIENTRTSWTTYVTSKDRLPQLKQHRDSTEETVLLYRKQFQLGDRTLLDLLDSENELFASNTAYVNGRYSELFAKYQILFNMGNLLRALNVPILPEGRLIA